MRFRPLGLEGAWVIDLEPNIDERGSFSRTFCEVEFAQHGLPTHFPQCNLSSNRRARTLRGMHVNTISEWESKLVRCVRGAIHDVLVDVRPGSATFGAHVGLELSASEGRAVFVPRGVAHGFLTLVDVTDTLYQMGSRYVPGAARGFRWDDPAFGIEWPADPIVMSDRDASYPDFDAAALGLVE